MCGVREEVRNPSKTDSIGVNIGVKVKKREARSDAGLQFEFSLERETGDRTHDPLLGKHAGCTLFREFRV